MKNEGMSLISSLDTAFIVCEEMIKDSGEDSCTCVLNESYGLTAVFDGCGGIGSRRYPQYDNRTGAYIASHTAAASINDWFEQFSQTSAVISNNTINEIGESISRSIVDNLRKYDNIITESTIKGSLTRKFPTTASIILFNVQDSMLNAAYFWAGDSRGFVLSPRGLTQVTRDDIEDGGDALANLRNDSKLTNLISADGNGVLHSRLISGSERKILITASDGCFGYFSTPMEFEYMILDTLMKSDSILAWQENIKQCIGQFTADDYSIGIVVFGYRSIDRLKKSMARRRQFLYNDYISKLNNSSEHYIELLWNEYKIGYYSEAI